MWLSLKQSIVLSVGGGGGYGLCYAPYPQKKKSKYM